MVDVHDGGSGFFGKHRLDSEALVHLAGGNALADGQQRGGLAFAEVGSHGLAGEAGITEGAQDVVAQAIDLFGGGFLGGAAEDKNPI